MAKNKHLHLAMLGVLKFHASKLQAWPTKKESCNKWKTK
jgi:hypothetical protein